MKAIASGSTALWYIRKARLSGQRLERKSLPPLDSWATNVRQAEEAGLGSLLREQNPCSFLVPAKTARTRSRKMLLRDWAGPSDASRICFQTRQRGLLALGPEACLVTLARDHSTAFLAMLIGEFCGSFSLDPSRLWHVAAMPICSIADIAAFAGLCPGARGIKKLRHALAIAGARSESPFEVQVRTWLCTPIVLGGWGCGAPSANQVIDLGPTFSRTQGRGRCAYRIDLFWPDARLAFECDGAQHDDEAQAEHDRLRDARLSQLDIKELRLSSAGFDDYGKACEYGLLARKHLGLSARMPEAAASRSLWQEIVDSEWEHVLKDSRQERQGASGSW